MTRNYEGKIPAIPLFAICEGNTYDYDDENTTTYDIDEALEWSRTKEVAVLDACDFSYHGLL